MADIVERLRGPAPLHWEAKEAADEITRLRNDLHLAQEWSARVIAGQEQDMTEITRLRAEVEDLGHRLHHVHRLWANNEHALRAKVERLEADLATARADALEEAARCADEEGWTEWRQKETHVSERNEAKRDCADEIAAAIRALKSKTGDTHLAHAGCCLLFLLAYVKRAVGKDNRP